MEKRLTAFINSINRELFTGPREQNITGLCYDSRYASTGSLFFALPGLHTDGKRFIDDAVKRGATTVIYEGELSRLHPGVSYIRVKNSRSAMSTLSAAFFDHPSRELTVIGVTGTDGKSTTVSFIYQLLQACGMHSGFLSTVQFNTGGAAGHNYLRQSTPEAPEIHGLLAEMRDNGVKYAAVEATSHGLSEKTQRLRDVRFSSAVITNITHEHLEFHGSFAAYRHDKANLFRNAAIAVINRDDPHAEYFLAAADRAGSRSYTYSLQASAVTDFRLLSYEEQPDSIDFHFSYGGEDFSTSLPFIGSFNIENYAAAFLAVQTLTGCSPGLLARSAAKLHPVAGRMNVIRAGQPFRIIVDYAHTPGSFAKVLPVIREQTEKRLIAVFGSAGERDVEKRPQQGKLADRYCDILVLTDEDPRGEDPLSILKDIAAGCTGKEEGENLLLIPDRREAIKKAFSLAEAGDTVLLLGKGHEKSIIYKDGAIEWDESAEALKCLQGY